MAGTLAVIGEKWSLLVLREAFLGVRRFADFQRILGAPKAVLTDRLGTLVASGILARVPYQAEGERQRHEYRLTEKGFALFPVMVAVAQWGDRYLADADGPPVEFVHRDCGAPVEAHLRCHEGHEVDEPRNVVARPGRGVRPAGSAQA